MNEAIHKNLRDLFKGELSPEDRNRIAAEIAETERMNEIRRGLPFLYGWKWYTWARQFYESRKKITLLCAGNQLSKSSTQIRKCINWATDKSLWPELWPDEEEPNQFWYLYPSQDVVNAEFHTKWKQFLPTGSFMEDPVYGWKPITQKGDIIGIEFNSGVFLYFKTYGQKATNLQTGTVYALFCDEELPIHLFDELMLRINAVNGYFSMVFTATLGQDEWRRAMDPEPDDEEFLPQAEKITASAYDSMHYEDGTPSKWTIQRIKQAEARCSTHAEILKRIYGKFILTTGRKYEAFDSKRHYKQGHKINKTWALYAGVDIGSGGDGTGHPAAICFVAVSPDYKEGRVVHVWRGDRIETTAGDVYDKYLEICNRYGFKPVRKFYDYGSKDFDIISRNTFEKAEKSHEIGEQIINTLFKNDKMFLYDDDDPLNEVGKLKQELSTLRKNMDKRKAKDDAADAFRYAITKIPWDFSDIGEKYDVKPIDPDANLTPAQRIVKERREAFEQGSGREEYDLEQEFEEWNDAYG